MKKPDLNLDFLYEDERSAEGGRRRLEEIVAARGMARERPFGDLGEKVVVVALACGGGATCDFQWVRGGAEAFAGLLVTLRHAGGADPLSDPSCAGAVLDLFEALFSVSGARAAYIDVETSPGSRNRVGVVDLGANPAFDEAERLNREAGGACVDGRDQPIPIATVPGEERLRGFDPARATIAGWNLANAFSARFVAAYGHDRLAREAPSRQDARELAGGGVLVVPRRSAPRRQPKRL